MIHKTLAVIGHVDHGKTALVKALTGVDTDTLTEEKQRGLTISLGFAHLETTAGKLHLIDAPGHADFVRTMAAGLSGVDAALLAVSVADGIQTQTREHLQIARCLGVRDILVALTKADLASDDAIERVRADIAALLKSFGLDPVALVPCSARAGSGLDALRAALDHYLGVPVSRLELPGFFLPIDRVFTAPGAGIVVTGTVIGAPIEVDTSARIGPEGLAISIRSIEVAGEAKTAVQPGFRAALGLRNLDEMPLKPGKVLHSVADFEASTRFDVALDPSGEDPAKLKHMDQVMVMLGTAYEPARVRFHAQAFAPDEERLVQLDFQRPQVGYRGQRFVVRNPAAGQTLCGGEIIDPVARVVRRNKPLHLAVLRAASSGDAAAMADALADRDDGEVALADLARLTGRSSVYLSQTFADTFELTSATHAVRVTDVQQLAERYLATLAGLHEARPVRPHHPVATLRAAMPRVPGTLMRHVERRLLDDGRLRVQDTMRALAGHEPMAEMTSDQRSAYADTEQRLSDLSLQPAALFEADKMTPDQEDIVELLIAQRDAIRLFNHALNQHVLLHASAITSACETLRRAFPAGDSFTTGEARTVLKTNRKIVVPLLEYFDAQGITRREGDVRYLRDARA